MAMIVILMTPEVCMLLENIYTTGVTHDDHHLWLPYFHVQATDYSATVLMVKMCAIPS